MAALAPSTRLVDNNVDERKSDLFPISQHLIQFLVPDGVNTLSIPKSLNGKLQELLVTGPQIPTDTVFTLTITDEDGQVLYTKNDFADNSVVTKVDLTASTPPVLLVGNLVWKINFITALSGDTAAFDVKAKFTSEF